MALIRWFFVSTLHVFGRYFKFQCKRKCIINASMSLGVTHPTHCIKISLDFCIYFTKIPLDFCIYFTDNREPTNRQSLSNQTLVLTVYSLTMDPGITLVEDPKQYAKICWIGPSAAVFTNVDVHGSLCVSVDLKSTFLGKKKTCCITRVHKNVAYQYR